MIDWKEKCRALDQQLVRVAEKVAMLREWHEDTHSPLPVDGKCNWCAIFDDLPDCVHRIEDNWEEALDQQLAKITDKKEKYRTLDQQLAKITDKVIKLRKQHGDTRTCLLTMDGECKWCAIFDCPHDCAFHYHHSGCPECIRDPYCEIVAYPNIVMPPASYSDADYPFNNKDKSS
jgi:hypothetical protein